MSFTTCVDWVIAKVQNVGAFAPPSVTEVVQLMIPGNNPDLHQASSVREKLSAESNGRILKLVVAAVPRPIEQRRQNSLQGVLMSLLKVSNMIVPVWACHLLFSHRQCIGAF